MDRTHRRQTVLLYTARLCISITTIGDITYVKNQISNFCYKYKLWNEADYRHLVYHLKLSLAHLLSL